MNRYTVQAIYMMESGKVHSMLPVDVDGEQALEDFERKVKYSLVQEEYLIEGRNARNHFVVLRPAQVETAVVDIKGCQEIQAYEEPAYDELKAKWEEALAEPEETDAPESLAMTPEEESIRDSVRAPFGPAVVSVVAKEAAEVEISPETTQSIKIPKPSWAKQPDDRFVIQDPEQDAERTQPMTVLKAEEVRAMEAGLRTSQISEMMDRVAEGVSVPGSTPEEAADEKPLQGPPAPRRRARGGPRGKGPNPR